MKLIIDLQDHEGHSYRKSETIFDDKASVDQLKDEIFAIFRIDKRNQELFFKENQIIGYDTLEEANIKHNDTIILKHALLVNWTTYLELIEKIRGITTSGMTSWKRQLALEALEFMSPLIATKFFITYPGFIKKRDEIDSEINFLIHNTKKYLMRALTKYFNSLFEGKDLELIEKPKQADGIQFGVFVFVKDNSNRPISSYYAKTIGNMPEIAHKLKPKIDLNELFVYQLFKIIGIGASEVHIISDGLRSGRVYLATKLMDNFFTASGNSADQILGRAPSTACKKQIVIDEEMIKPLKILASLLCLEDLISNKGNYGFIERQPTEEEKKEGKEESIQELRIVDFRVNVALGSSILKSKKEILYLEKYFEKWNMMNSIDEARKLIEDDEAIKYNMESLNMDYFNFYFTQIKKTLQDFINNPRKTKAE